MQPLRLLFAIQCTALGGAALHAIELAQRLRARGHTIASTCRPGGAIQRALTALSPAIDVHEIDSYSEMAALIDRWQPHVVQHFDGLSAPAGVELARHRSRSVQVVHANHALDPSGRAIPVQGSDVLVAVSDSAARFHPARAGAFPLRVIWNGIDTRHYTPAPHAPDLPPLRLLSVGRLDEASKRLSVLIDVCAALPSPDWHLTLLGDGPDRDRFARQIRQRGLDDRVALVPFHGDPAPYYRAAHVYLSAAESEGFGRSLAEAAATGLAIVARRCHGVTDLFEAGAHALLAGRDPELTAALARLQADAALRARLGRAARELAMRHLEVTRMLDAYERLYCELLERPAVPRADAPALESGRAAC